MEHFIVFIDCNKSIRNIHLSTYLIPFFLCGLMISSSNSVKNKICAKIPLTSENTEIFYHSFQKNKKKNGIFCFSFDPLERKQNTGEWKAKESLIVSFITRTNER